MHHTILRGPAMGRPGPSLATSATSAAPRYRVVVLDEERRLDPCLRALLVRALPAVAEHLASRSGSVDAAPDRGE